MKPQKLGIVMDPLASIQPKKDTTLALMLEAQHRGWELAVIEMPGLFLDGGLACAKATWVAVFDDTQHWFDVLRNETLLLGEFDVILMRKDPPFDMEYIMSTYILERAQEQGAWVVNAPRALRDANEKVFTAWFAEYCPPSLLSRSKEMFKDFLARQGKIVVKPTHKMGGQGIFVISEGDPNTNVILEELTQREQQFVQAQKYIPEIASTGDKRIILVDGTPLNTGIARIPGKGDHRGNLAAGAKAIGFELSQRDREICAQLTPKLQQMGLSFVGIDVIGDYLTEINVTSPTGIREIKAQTGEDGGRLFFDFLEKKLAIN